METNRHAHSGIPLCDRITAGRLAKHRVSQRCRGSATGEINVDGRAPARTGRAMRPDWRDALSEQVRAAGEETRSGARTGLLRGFAAVRMSLIARSDAHEWPGPSRTIGWVSFHRTALVESTRYAQPGGTLIPLRKASGLGESPDPGVFRGASERGCVRSGRARARIARSRNGCRGRASPPPWTCRC